MTVVIATAVADVTVDTPLDTVATVVEVAPADTATVHAAEVVTTTPTLAITATTASEPIVQGMATITSGILAPYTQHRVIIWGMRTRISIATRIRIAASTTMLVMVTSAATPKTTTRVAATRIIMSMLKSIKLLASSKITKTMSSISRLSTFIIKNTTLSSTGRNFTGKHVPTRSTTTSKGSAFKNAYNNTSSHGIMSVMNTGRIRV